MSEAPLLLHGDCLDLLAALPDSSVDFVCCDPPYGITTAQWDKPLDWAAVWKELTRVCTPAGVVALFASNRFAMELYATNPRLWRYKWIWVKSQGTDFLNSRFKPLNNTEEILVFYMGKVSETWYEPQMKTGAAPYTKIRKPGEEISQIWGHRNGKTGTRRTGDLFNKGTRYPVQTLNFKAVSPGQRKHNCQKPADLLSHLVKSHCPGGGVVLDFCMGSGSTGVAAVSAGRRFVGMELDSEYFVTASKAVMQAWTNRCGCDEITPPLQGLNNNAKDQVL